jgi:hypothetical protein
LSTTTVRASADKLELAQLKGINVSKVFREALDVSLKVMGDEKEMLESQLTDIRKQIEILNLEEKLILDQLKTLESADTLENYRLKKYDQWKKNIAFQVNKNTIDWDVIRKLLRFNSKIECKKWINENLQGDGL